MSTESTVPFEVPGPHYIKQQHYQHHDDIILQIPFLHLTKNFSNPALGARIAQKKWVGSLRKIKFVFHKKQVKSQRTIVHEGTCCVSNTICCPANGPYGSNVEYQRCLISSHFSSFIHMGLLPQMKV